MKGPIGSLTGLFTNPCSLIPYIRIILDIRVFQIFVFQIFVLNLGRLYGIVRSLMEVLFMKGKLSYDFYGSSDGEIPPIYQ